MRISDWSSDVCSSDLLGFSADAERDEAGRLEADDDALVRLLLEQEVAPSVASQEECRRYYDANQKRFRTPELFEASHILIEPSGEDAAAWSAAEIQARSIAAEVGDRAESFAAIGRASGRDRGWQSVEVWVVAVDLKKTQT